MISGCSFGYHAGGWGKPPVDERGRPLYGDVFGVENPVGQYEDEKPSEQLWGELDSDEESSSDDESEDESEEEGDQDGTGVPTQAEPSSTLPDGMETPSGTQSQVPDPMQAPAEIELRKSQPTQKVRKNPKISFCKIFILEHSGHVKSPTTISSITREIGFCWQGYDGYKSRV